MSSNLTERLVRRELASYLAGERTIRQFNVTIVNSVQLMDNHTAPDFRNLVHGLELWIAEFSSGYWSEAELREKIRPFLSKVDTSNKESRGRTKANSPALARKKVANA